MILSNYSIRLGMLSLLLILLAGCSSNEGSSYVPSFMQSAGHSLPPPELPQADENQTILQNQPPIQTAQEPANTCILSGYKYINKLCIVSSFWSDFSLLMEKYVSYKWVLLICAIIFLIWWLGR